MRAVAERAVATRVVEDVATAEAGAGDEERRPDGAAEVEA